MAVSTNAPQQTSQPSRKTKRAWRKNIDVSEIQRGLDTVRDELIKGGVIAEKPSELLFTLDTVGSEAIQQEYNKVHKPLRADQILAQRSAIPAVDTRKRSSDIDGYLGPNKGRKGNGVKPQEYVRLKNRAYGGEAVPKDIVKADGIPEFDPWNDDAEDNQDPQFSYLEKPKPITAPRTLQEAPISLLKNSKPMPSVPKPNAGISYNPVFRDWDELLTREGQKEVEAEKKRIQVAVDEQERLTRIEAAHNEPEEIYAEYESVWEGIDSDFENAEWLNKRRPERKTQPERNKIKRRKEAERQAKYLAETKRQFQQAQRIKEIAAQIEFHHTARAILSAADEESSSSDFDDRLLRRRKLGKVALPQRPLELVLPDELQESLRQLKPEGNLLQERYRNLLVRGKMETRRAIQQPKKKRRTVTEKWTYKDFMVTA